LATISNGNPVLCSKSLAADYRSMTAAIEEARCQLDRDVIDIFLLHEVRPGQLEERARAWEALNDARARGLVKAIGLSTHHVDVTGAAADLEELDVVFPLLNYQGLGIRKGQHFATADEMLAAIGDCRRAGKGVFTMKAFGGGSLTASYQKSLDFILSQPHVDAVMVGLGSRREIDDLLTYLNGQMPAAYNPDVSHKRIHISQEDCEGCGACRKACPAGAIFWNAAGLAEVDPSRCLTCGYCTPVCPVRAVILY
jgi:predicted aldo/keto reductase-like oxidoreductase